MDKTQFTKAVWDVGPIESILTIDPDARTPGAAFAQTYEGATCFVWGGRQDGAPLAAPNDAKSILGVLAPTLVVIEAPLPSGGRFARSMHAQNIVRGGWIWICALAGIPCVQASPMSWQAPFRSKTVPTKTAYKVHAASRALVKSINEDAAAAFCMLEYTLLALGLRLPEEVLYRPPGCYLA